MNSIDELFLYPDRICGFYPFCDFVINFRFSIGCTARLTDTINTGITGELRKYQVFYRTVRAATAKS
jgi:hypothetical protein